MIILLGMAITVYARVFLKESQAPSGSQNVIEQLEQSLELFTGEIEEENKQVFNHIVVMKQEFQAKTHQLELRLSQLEKYENSEPKGDVDLKDTDTIKQRYTRLFQLYGEGHSIEAISREIDLPKGEVQLIIKLAQQEEAEHG